MTMIRVGSKSIGATSALAATLERKLEGASVTLLAVCDSDQASVGLEAMKRAFNELTAVDAEVAQRIIAAAAHVAAPDCAALVLSDRTAFAAASGEARVYRQRAHKLEPVASGTHEVAPAQALLVANHALKAQGQDFFQTGPGMMLAQAMVRDLGAKGLVELGQNTFRNETLEALLEQALSESKEANVAVAALSLGFLHLFEVEDAPVTKLTPELLEAASAVSKFSAARLISRAAEQAEDHAAIPLAIKEFAAVNFIAEAVGRHGTNLENVVARFGPTPNFLATALKGLARIGALEHRRILLETVPFLVHFNPELEPIMQELALTPIEKSNTWGLTSQWGDAPDLERLAEWHINRAFTDYTHEAPTNVGSTLTPPDELVRSPTRKELVAQLSRLLGVPLSDDTPLSAEQVKQISIALDHPVKGETVTNLLNYVYDEERSWALLRLS
jgi:hypothetical protein